MTLPMPEGWGLKIWVREDDDMGVWMVHVETCQYSDRDYRVCGVFSTREAARDYVLGQRVPVDCDGIVVEQWQDRSEVSGHLSPTMCGGDDWHFEVKGEDWFITEYELDVGAAVEHGFGYVSVTFPPRDAAGAR